VRHTRERVTGTCQTNTNIPPSLVLSLLPAWFTALSDDDVSDDFQLDEVTTETQGIAMPPPTAPFNFF
jgi:hypothetical protein